MDPRRPADEPRESRFDGLHAEAKAAIGYSANTLRAVRERYREAYLAELGRWHELRDELERMQAVDRGPVRRSPTPDGASAASAAENDRQTLVAAEAGAEDARRRAVRREEEHLTSDLGVHQRDLAKLELAQKNLEDTWVFLERGDVSLLAPPDGPTTETENKMRIVEAQDAERSRLAQEIHDGPAQALSNAILQVDYIERFLEDGGQARAELRFLRELLRRELGDVRALISQLRPPVLDELGLNGAIEDAVESMSALIGIPIGAELNAPQDVLDDAQQTVVLRIVQETLQNVRKHAHATRVSVVTRTEGETWLLEVHDDGRGFDVGAIAARGRRNFGLQFMRARSELIGATFEVRSRPDGGTVVRLSIPTGGEEHS